MALHSNNNNSSSQLVLEVSSGENSRAMSSELDCKAMAVSSPADAARLQLPHSASSITVITTTNGQAHAAGTAAGGSRWTPRAVAGRLGAQLHRELHAYGAMVCTTFSPAATGHHWVLFMPCLAAVLCCVWASTAAFYPYWLMQRDVLKCQAGDPAALSACVAKASPINQTAPGYMLSWLQGDDSRAFDLSFDYLVSWGGLYAVRVADGQWWRLFTSQFVHYNFLHLVGNTVVVLVLGSALERRFGWWRVLLVWAAAVVGGDMLSMLAEDPCDQVVGASGGAFGLVGLFAADLVMNRGGLELPILQLAMTVVFLAIFGVTVLTQKGISNMSHLGGLACGVFMGMVVLPVLAAKRDKLQHALRALGLVLLSVWFITTPWLVWQRVLPNLSCS